MKTPTRPEPIGSPDRPPSGRSAAPKRSRIPSISWDMRAEGDLAMLAEQMVECAPVAMLALDTNTLRVAVANERARVLYAEVLGPTAPALLGAMLQRYQPLLQRHDIWSHLRAA